MSRRHAVVGKLWVDVVLDVTVVWLFIATGTRRDVRVWHARHTLAVTVAIVHLTIDAAGPRHLVLVVHQVVDTILGRDETELSHVVGYRRHLAHTIDLTTVTLHLHLVLLLLRLVLSLHLLLLLDLLLSCLLSLLLRRGILLNMGLWVRQMAGSSGVAATNGALLEVSLENVTAGERIMAKEAHVGSIAGVCTLMSESSQNSSMEGGTHVEGDGASDAWRGDRSWYSGGMGICRPRPSGESGSS